MRLREVIRAIDGFRYEVNEYELFPSGKVITRKINLKIDQTNIRCLQHNMHHEKQVKGGWFIITPDQFALEAKTYKSKPVVVTRKKNQTTVKPLKLTLQDLAIPTDHFIERFILRFQGSTDPKHLKTFLDPIFNDHFIVQNYHFYNGRSMVNAPEYIAVCSRDFKTVVIIALDGPRFKLVTCYNPFDDEYEAFSNWFQDHIDHIHEMPTLHDFLRKG